MRFAAIYRPFGDRRLWHKPAARSTLPAARFGGVPPPRPVPSAASWPPRGDQRAEVGLPFRPPRPSPSIPTRRPAAEAEVSVPLTHWRGRGGVPNQRVGGSSPPPPSPPKTRVTSAGGGAGEAKAAQGLFSFLLSPGTESHPRPGGGAGRAVPLGCQKTNLLCLLAVGLWFWADS